MIHANTSFQKTRKTEGVKIPSVKEIGKERKEVLTLLKKALEDFREGLSHSKDSYLQKTSEQKLNYLNELLKEKINGQTEDINKQISSYTVKLTDKEKKEISNELKKQFSDITPSLIDKIIGCLEDVIKKDNTKEDGNTSPKVKIEGEVDEDILEKYFDDLYKKNEKYQGLKDTLVNEMSESHNQNMRLIKERIKQYKDNLKSYETKIRKANSKIAELQDNKRISNNSALQNNRFENKRDRKNKEKKVKQTNNLIQDNLLTQQIVDQVRRNENLSISPKDKQLSPEHTKSANNLIDKFYKNGLIELKLTNWKNTFKGVSKILGMIISPIGWLAGKIFGVAKTIGLSLFKLGKFIFKSFENVFLVGLLSPAGAYTIGFLAGYIAEYIKDKWTNNEGWDGKAFGFIKNLFNIIMDCFVTPIIKISKEVIKIAKVVGGWIAEHPLIFSSLILLLEGIKFTFKNFSKIRTAYTIVGKGFKFAGPMLAGIAASAATNAIFSNTVFKSKADNAISWYKSSSEAYTKFKSEMNHSVLQDMNDQDVARYQTLNQNMEEEDKRIENMFDMLEFLHKNAQSEEHKNKKIDELYGESFIESVYDSPLFGKDEEGYNQFYNQYKKLSLQDQVEKLISALSVRRDMLARMAGTISQSSTIGKEALTKVVDTYIEQDKVDNGKIIRKTNKEQMDRLRKMGRLSGNELTDKNFVYMRHLNIGDGYVAPIRTMGTITDFSSQGMNKPDVTGFIEQKKQQNVKSYESQYSVSNSRFLNISEAQNALNSKAKVDQISKKYDKTKQIYQSFLKDNNLDNTVFSSLVDYEELQKTIESSGDDGQDLSEKLSKYLDEVKRDYLERSKGKNKALGDDIKDLEDDISKLDSEIIEQNEKIKEYHMRGIR